MIALGKLASWSTVGAVALWVAASVWIAPKIGRSLKRLDGEYPPPRPDEPAWSEHGYESALERAKREEWEQFAADRRRFLEVAEPVFGERYGHLRRK